ncbi:MAG: sporulation integral membrane protein YtvI [Faecalibacterium sp.]|nr:sporulation integral membrane protein YtvI [Ruminococcus sp.]MCM1391462.1 sporulation integral membrane protein YtvI [Ruminococcus sp.]MCM1485280.1 sporulation integral membrane protein YtvI [Faecalibacterium sp.]
MKDVEKRRNTLINFLYFAMILAIVVVALRYAVGVCLPFIIAFVVAAVLQKPKNFIVRKTPLKKGAASGICVLLTIVIIVSLIALIGVRVSTEIKGFIDYIMIQLQDFDKVIDNVENWIMNLVNSAPEFLRKTLNESVTQMFAQLRDSMSGNSDELASQIKNGIGGNFSLSWITTPINGVISTAKQLPSVFVSVIISLVACCFMTSEFPEIINFFKLQFPENRRKDLSRAKVILKDSLGKMAKAYALIIVVTFVEMSIGLTILKLLHVFDSSYIILIAAATAIVDILPVLGTGTVLMPWALYSFIIGNVGMGIGLIVIYAAISIIRQVIEPKLVAGQLGLSPIVTIAALYFGLKLFGVLGMFVTPLLVIMLKLLNDEGIVKLWKSPAKVKAAQAETEKAKPEDKPEENETEN